MKTRKNQSRAARAPMFSRSSIGSAVAMALIASSGAQAADTTVSPALNGTASGNLTAAVPQSNAGAVNAQITNATVGTVSSGSSSNPAPVTQVTNGNLIGASATGNVASNKIGAPGPVIPLGSDAALGLSINTGTITSKVETSETRVQSNTFQTGSVVNADNTISAETTLNSGTTLVTGKAGPGPVFAGSATLIFPVGGPQLFDASGNVVVTSMQLAAGAGSSAIVQGNSFALQLTSSSNSAVTSGASASLERNTVLAAFKGNSANSTAEIQSGGAPTFAGSAVVSNLQANGIIAATQGATNANSSVVATVQGVGPGVVNALQGTLTVKGNGISSAATGNEAAGAAAGTAGNRIVVGDVSVAGTGTAATALNDSTHAGVGVVTHVSSDLAIVNSQANLGTGPTSALTALTTGAVVYAGAQSLDGGTINLQDNRITAAVTGNVASSDIAAGTGSAASFTGTAAESNQQANYQTFLQAKVNPSLIEAQAGDGASGTAAGVVTVSGNRSAATAQGNQVSQSLAIQAGTVALGNEAAMLTGGTSSDGRVSASGAVTLTNLQGNYDSTVGAYNGAPLLAPGSQILLLADSGAAPLSKSALTLSSNRQESVAVGNGAGNSLALTGNSVGTGAGIASVQMGDGTSYTSAALSNAEARVLVNGSAVTDSSITLADNLQRSIAYGNAVSNTVNVKANDVLVLASPSVASTVTIAVANSRPFDNTLATQPVVTASYGVLNDQSVLANVNATTSGAGSFAVNVAGGVSGSTVGNDRNAYVAAAYGNDAASGVKLDVGNLSSKGPAAVANVTNTQAVGGAGTRIDAVAGGGTAVRTAVGGDLANSTLTANDNAAQALAYGSRATGNTVTVKGTNINTAGPALSGANLSAAGVLTTDATFSVQNAQAGQGAVLADRGGPEVRVQVDGAVGFSTVKANGNQGSAAATSNSAVNGVGIDAVNLASTSALQNAQITTADVTSRVGAGGVGGAQVAVNGALILGANISVDGNGIQSTATGNEATSSIDVKGTGIASANGLPVAFAGNGGGAAGAIADHALSNAQLVGGGVVSARADSSFGIDTAPGAVIAASQLSVSDNVQRARSIGNTATNSVALAGTNVSARAALQSTQASLADVRSQSVMQAFAPAAVAGGSTEISGNSNTAQSVVNDASNTVSVKGDNTTGFAGPAVLLQGVLPGTTLAVGDQVLLNRQSAVNAASSVATTTIVNDDRTLPTAGLLLGSFDASGNKTYAEATANRASNASTLSGGAQQASRTAVMNVQDSSAAVTTTASSTVGLTLNGPAAFNASQATLEGNIVSGAATGNSAVNSLEVKGGTVGDNALIPVAVAGAISPAIAGAAADHALVNVQFGTGAVSSTVTGSVGIDTTPGAAIGAATLSVSGNKQSASAVGNTAANSVSLAGTNVSARSALQSVQAGGAPVTASSTSALFAPVGSTASGVRLSGNSNTALGVINDVENTLSVSATNTGAANASGAVALIEAAPGVVLAAGDHVLSNRQAASASVGSTATTTISNDDNGVGATALLNGSLAITGNTTIAEASANRATNTATVAASAVQGANVGIVNSQGSSAATTATASTVATVALTAATPLNGGSISLDGNTTAALARGNSATNTLDSAAGSGYGAASAVGTVATLPALNVGASAAILNSQTNTGAVTASSTGTSYQVALNSTTAVSVAGASVGVTGNTLAAQASGNSATNRLTQTALNGSAPSAAIGSFQVNTGAVTATVTSVNFGVGVTGAVTNGSLRASGNQITASATGNSVVSSIAGR